MPEPGHSGAVQVSRAPVDVPVAVTDRAAVGTADRQLYISMPSTSQPRKETLWLARISPCGRTALPAGGVTPTRRDPPPWLSPPNPRQAVAFGVNRIDLLGPLTQVSAVL